MKAIVYDKSIPGRLELRAVSRFVNRPGNEGPECLAAAES